MGEPFIGEIKLIGFTFAPKHWADCKGQTMQINQAQSLYSLIGVQFGGDGRSNFLLPDMRGRVPVHPENKQSQGLMGGLENSALVPDHLPAHTHDFYAANIAGDQFSIDPKAESFLAQPEDGDALPIYGAAANLVELDSAGVEPAGGGDYHSNLQPSLVIRYAIALQGLYPSRN